MKKIEFDSTFKAGTELRLVLYLQHHKQQDF